MNKQERMDKSSWTTYKTIGILFAEARRMTRAELQDVATEVHGTTDKPSKIATAKGYNPKRTKKEVRRVEKRGAKPISQEDIEGMSSADLAQNTKPGIVGKAKLMGRALLQRKTRGHTQNIPKMVKTMKRDPGEFPAAVSFSADQRTKGQPGHKTKARPTAVTGRTRMAVASATGKQAHGITLPAERYAGSAERHDKWVRSGGKAEKVAQLAAKGRRLGGQDPRNESIINTYRNIGAILAEALDPKGWRTWPLDPKDPKKGTLSAQNIWAQERPKDPALTNWGMGHAGRPYATRRTRVTTPATDLGIKGTKTNHTTATNFETKRDPQNGWTRSTAQIKSKGPMAITRSTSVKGKIKNDDGTTKQVNVKNFPTRHSSRK